MPRNFLLPSVGSPKILPTVEQKYSENNFLNISFKEYFFTFIDFQSITSHCKATGVFRIEFSKYFRPSHLPGLLTTIILSNSEHLRISVSNTFHVICKLFSFYLNVSENFEMVKKN